MMRIIESEYKAFGELGNGEVFKLQNGEICLKIGKGESKDDFNAFNISYNTKMIIEPSEQISVMEKATLLLHG